MNNNQVIYAIYNYLMNEEARLDIAAYESGKFISPNFITPERVIKFLKAHLKHQYFKEFSRVIYDILKYYVEN